MKMLNNDNLTLNVIDSRIDAVDLWTNIHKYLFPGCSSHHQIVEVDEVKGYAIKHLDICTFWTKEQLSDKQLEHVLHIINNYSIVGRPDVFSYHEAMDRANQISEILSTMLDGHSIVEYEPKVKSAYNKATIALNHLYNTTAEASFAKYPEGKMMYNREETDTRYANGVACMYANLISVITGHPADQFIKACQMFIDQTAKYHESVRNNFVPADGFFSQIMKMQEVLTD